MTSHRILSVARLAALLAAVVLLAPTADAEESPLLQAMRDEMSRAMAGLRMPGQPAPYFIACTIDDIAGRQIAATLGAGVVGQPAAQPDRPGRRPRR